MFKAIIPISIHPVAVKGSVKATGQVTVEASGEATGEVSGEVQKVIGALDGEMKRAEIQKKLGLKHDDYFRLNYIEPAMKAGFIEMTYPESPNHPNQKYRLTVVGEKLKKKISDK